MALAEILTVAAFVGLVIANVFVTKSTSHKEKQLDVDDKNLSRWRGPEIPFLWS